MPSAQTPIADDDELVIEIGAGDVEDGTYTATLTAIEPLTVDTTNPDTGQAETRDLLRWVFAIEPEGREVRGLTSRATGPKSKLYKWIGAMLGADALGTGVKFRRRDLIGREIMLVVGRDKNGWGTVTDVVPLPKKAATR
jgi:hypothetical protein